MRTKNRELLDGIVNYIEEYCNANGSGASVRELAAHFGESSTNIHRYVTHLIGEGKVCKGRHGYESAEFASTDRAMRSVAILGAVPCGELCEIEECVEGYLRLPEVFVGKGKFFILKASGTSMVGAGIDDGDWVLVRQESRADVGDIVVALVDNEVTLKRLAARDGVYYLHPENKEMKDIYVDNLVIQGVAVKVIKNL